MATSQLLLFPVSTRPPLSIPQNTHLISFRLQSNRLHIKTFGVRSSKPCPRCRPLSISSKLVTETNKDPPEDFMSRVLKENPSQLEPRFLVGGNFLTLREMEALPKNKMEQVVSEIASKLPRRVVWEETVGGEGTKREEPVYLNDILREFKGKLYVPEGMFRAALSEEEDFDKNVRELPKLSLDDLITYLQADKIKLLTSKSPTGILANVRHRDFIVDLKEIPGVRSLQQTKWAIKLSADEARDVLAEYTGPQYEIEKHTSCAGKLLEYPNPVASSIANRILVELGVVTAVVVFTAVVAYGYMALAVYVAACFLYVNFKYIIWPLAEPLLELVLGIVSKIAERSRENIFDTFSEGGLLSKLQEFYTFGGVSSSLAIMKPILLILTTMVLLIRFTISRRQKNYKKWDIWQGIEFSQSKAHARADGSTGVLFSDVAGIDEAVEELKELVEYLKNPKLFDEKGIKPPHGVLLEGPPGCGKTLVAKAIAGEAGVPFYQMAGSEFVEILVGVGSARIRDLFKRAKVNKPSVVFIDEIDALAARRQGIFNETTHYLHNVNIQERETTLNQLLIELDGFDTGKGVIFLGATNRMDLLDPALLRPGRFDRKIRIRPPGAKGRLDILRVHASKVNMSSSVDLSLYAQNLPGWSGAQLAQLLQEAALIAVRNGHESIIQSDMDNAVDRLTMGPIRVNYELGNQGQSRRAVTEVGTAITSLLLRRYENANIELCERISIHPRGQTLSQIVFRRLDDEAYMLERKPQLLHRLQVLLGGRAAEAVIHGRDTSEASSNYLADASWLARKILTIWNLENPMTVHGEPAPWWKSIKFVGPRLDFEGSLYDDYGMVEPPLNSSLEDQVARRTEELVQEMYKKTFSLLRRHQAVLIKTVKVLLDRKEIRRDHMEYIINTYPAETPVSRVLEEKNPEWLPIFESENEHHKVLLSAHPAELSLS